MAFKFRVKLGSIEVEYEGDKEFDKKKILDLVTEVIRIHESAGRKAHAGSTGAAEGLSGSTDNSAGLKLTTRDIASKLKLGKGRNLLLAACLQLELVQGKASCTREEILAQAKTATGFYKASLVNNLSKYLDQLGDKLNEVEPNTYAIKNEVLSALKDKLANS